MIRVKGPVSVSTIKPHTDLKDLPRKLVHASKEERMCLLLGIHERFWHASPQDMLRLLQAALLPRHIILEGIEAATNCEHCRKFASKLHRPQIKSHIAAHFNEYVYHDLFFAWDQTFMLLIDECVRWKTGDHIPDKEAKTIVKALVNL